MRVRDGVSVGICGTGPGIPQVADMLPPHDITAGTGVHRTDGLSSRQDPTRAAQEVWNTDDTPMQHRVMAAAGERLAETGRESFPPRGVPPFVDDSLALFGSATRDGLLRFGEERAGSATNLYDGLPVRRTRTVRSPNNTFHRPVSDGLHVDSKESASIGRADSRTRAF